MPTTLDPSELQSVNNCSDGDTIDINHKNTASDSNIDTWTSDVSKIRSNSPNSTIDAEFIFDSANLETAETNRPNPFISSYLGPLRFLPSVFTVSTSSRSTSLPRSASYTRYTSFILLSTLVGVCALQYNHQSHLSQHDHSHSSTSVLTDNESPETTGNTSAYTMTGTMDPNLLISEMWWF